MKGGCFFPIIAERRPANHKSKKENVKRGMKTEKRALKFLAVCDSSERKTSRSNLGCIVSEGLSEGSRVFCRVILLTFFK